MSRLKHLLTNAEDPFLELLANRATTMPWCGKSPAELLMGRSLRSTVSKTNNQLVPSWSYLRDFRACNTQLKARQKAHYDRTHRVRELPVPPDGTYVWVTSNGNPTPGQTMTTMDAPRSYIVQTPTGEVRCNRRHLNTNPRAECNTDDKVANRTTVRSKPGPSLAGQTYLLRWAARAELRAPPKYARAAKK